MLAQSFYPGWRAFLGRPLPVVSGGGTPSPAAPGSGRREVEISKWDGIFQAVSLPAGDFTLKVEFEPTWWNELVLLAAAAWLAWLSLALQEAASLAEHS